MYICRWMAPSFILFKASLLMLSPPKLTVLCERTDLQAHQVTGCHAPRGVSFGSWAVQPFLSRMLHHRIPPPLIKHCRTASWLLASRDYIHFCASRKQIWYSAVTQYLCWPDNPEEYSYNLSEQSSNNTCQWNTSSSGTPWLLPALNQCRAVFKTAEVCTHENGGTELLQ